MDQQIEQAVWQRVRTPGGGLPARDALLPERLEALIVEGQADAGLLQRLAPQLNGQSRQELNRMAAELRAGTRELTTLHYLLTGRRLRLSSPAPKLPPSVPEALRLAFRRSRETERAYAALAAEFTDYAADFHRMQEAGAARSRRLARVLERLL